MVESRNVMTGANCWVLTAVLAAPPEYTNAPVQLAFAFRLLALLLKWSIVAFSSSHMSNQLLKAPMSLTLSVARSTKWLFSALSSTATYASATTPGVDCKGMLPPFFGCTYWNVVAVALAHPGTVHKRTARPQ